MKSVAQILKSSTYDSQLNSSQWRTFSQAMRRDNDTTRVVFAMQAHAFRLWDMAKRYDKKGNPEAANNCRDLAKDMAKQCDAIASNKDARE